MVRTFGILLLNSYDLLIFPATTMTKSLFQSEARCEAIDMKMKFYSHANETHYRKKGFALSLGLKMRVFGTHKLACLPSVPFEFSIAIKCG